METKQIRKRFVTIAVLAVAAFALLMGGVATYAWFTSNQRVGTSRAEARTGEENVELLVSSTGGADFRGSDVADIVQLNKTDSEFLLPVSTADLVNFVLPSAYNGDGFPTAYSPVENEANYYHGRIYLRAGAGGVSTGSQMAVYLDQRAAAGGILVQKGEEESLLLNAARLGLALEGGERVIFYLSEETNPEGARMNNTILDGSLQREGVVLRSGGGRIDAVADPAVPVSSRSISDSGMLGTPLGYLELGRIYALDVYFYLEGCDPDCWDSIYFDASTLHLAFYGVLS